jgi:hypothetical protein
MFMKRIALDILSVARDFLSKKSKHDLGEMRAWIGIVTETGAKVKEARPGQTHTQVFGNYEVMTCEGKFMFNPKKKMVSWYNSPSSKDKAFAEEALGNEGFHSVTHHYGESFEFAAEVK